MGVLDFAGGIVVHLTCGAAALAAVLVTGPRKDHGRHQIVPHNLPMTLLGTGLLWFGWFGFNAGSALAADGVAAGAFAATHLGGMAGMATWSLIEWWHRGKPTTLGAASGAVAGLATITPGAGFVSPGSAVCIGMIAGVICYGAVLLKARLRFDDSLDVVGIHGVGGVLGTLLVGVLAQKLVNPTGADGLFFGNPGQLGIQLLAVAVVGVFAFVASWVILAVIKAVMGLRMTPQAETIGLDLSEHTESAYGE
jgi:ammonium transporter, Amt family